MPLIKIIKLVIVINALALLFACSEDKPSEPKTNSGNQTSSLNIKMQLQAATDLGINISRVTATITKGSFSQTVDLPIANDIATGSIADLAIGEYSVAIEIYDGTTLVGNGTGTATIAQDQTATADVSINLFKGALELTINVSTNNAIPNADSGTDQTIPVNSTVTLNGTASNDLDNADTLTYTWTQTTGENVTLTNATTASPSFSAPATTQTLTFSLKVNDGKADSNVSTVNINVINQNPIAHSGSNQTVGKNITVTLDASQSSDPDGDGITYVWAQTQGIAVTLSSNTAQQPTFTTPTTGSDLAFTLFVDDGNGNIEKQIVTITVQNQTPIANAGATQNAQQTSVVTLNGNNSTDPDNIDTLTYQWRQISGNLVILTNANQVQATFTTANQGDTLTFGLIVNDGTTDSVESTVTINVNHTPVANAGQNQSVAKNTQVTLNASASTDVETSNLNYAWTQTAGTTTALSSNTAQQPTLTTGTTTETLTYSLVVNDGVLNSSATTVNINVLKNAPTANAGSDQTIAKNQTVNLNGTASTTDTATKTYTWVQTQGSQITLNGANSSTPSFTAPNAPTAIQLQLTVNDGIDDSAVSAVTINVINQSPIANTGNDIYTKVSETATLNATQSTDPDGDAITYQWIEQTTSGVTLNNATTATASFTMPNTTTDLVFNLTISDGDKTSTDTVIVILDTVPQISIDTPTNAIEIQEGETLSFSATTTDGNAPFTYLWHFNGLIPNETVEDPGVKTINTPSAFNVPGKITLTVTDANGDTTETSISAYVKDTHFGVDILAYDSFSIMVQSNNTSASLADDSLAIMVPSSNTSATAPSDNIAIMVQSSNTSATAPSDTVNLIVEQNYIPTDAKVINWAVGGTKDLGTIEVTQYQTVSFNFTNGSQIINYQWSYGNGLTSSGNSLNIRFLEVATNQTVSVTVTFADGSTETYIVTINVVAPKVTNPHVTPDTLGIMVPSNTNDGALKTFNITAP